MRRDEGLTVPGRWRSSSAGGLPCTRSLAAARSPLQGGPCFRCPPPPPAPSAPAQREKQNQYTIIEQWTHTLTMLVGFVGLGRRRHAGSVGAHHLRERRQLLQK